MHTESSLSREPSSSYSHISGLSNLELRARDLQTAQQAFAGAPVERISEGNEEEDRLASEGQRLSRESERLSHESKRLSAESARYSAESRRRSEEANRLVEVRRDATAAGVAKEKDRASRERDRDERAGSESFQEVKDHDRSPRSSTRSGIGRMVNAAATALEEYFDAEPEDEPPKIPQQDRFEAMRERQRQLGAAFGSGQLNSGQRPPARDYRDGRNSKDLPAKERAPNSEVKPPPNQTVSPFASSELRQQRVSPPHDRRLLRQGGMISIERRGKSLEVPSHPVPPRPSIDSRQDLASRVPSGASDRHHSLDIAQGRANSYQLAQMQRRDLQLSAANRNVARAPSPPILAAPIEVERRRDVESQQVISKVALPWQLTALFGGATILGCIVGVVTMSIVISNAVQLQSQKNSTRLPDLKAQIAQLQALLNALVQLNADEASGRFPSSPPSPSI